MALALCRSIRSEVEKRGEGEEGVVAREVVEVGRSMIRSRSSDQVSPTKSDYRIRRVFCTAGRCTLFGCFKQVGALFVIHDGFNILQGRLSDRRERLL